MTPKLVRTLSAFAVVALVVAACGGGDDGDVDPTGAFDGVDGAESSDVTDADEDDGDGEEGFADTPRDSGPDGGAEGAGEADGPPAETTTPTVDAEAPGGGEGAGTIGSAGGEAEAALAVWDEFLEVWEGVRNGDGALDEMERVSVWDEALATLVGQSIEADEGRGATSVELHGGTRSEVTVDGSTVTFVDCVYEKSVGPLPWVLAQRWDVTVGLDAGPGGAPAVVSVLQRASVGEDGAVVYDVCLNPVLEQEVIAAHVALREMFVETQENPVGGIDDPRIDELLMPADAADFREALAARIEEGTRIVNGQGDQLRVDVFGHGLGFAASVSCEDQLDGFGRLGRDGDYVARADPQLQTLTTVRFVFTDRGWSGENVTNSSDFNCPAEPLASVDVAGGREELLSP